MNDNEVIQFLTRAQDGQSIRVTTASGRVFDGIYDASQSSENAGLYFENMSNGQELRADWVNVSSIEYRSARVSAGRMFVPDGHPLNPAGPVRYRPDGTPLRPHTSRNK